MRSLIRPIGLLVTTLFLSLIFTNDVLAFECANDGAGTTAPDDGGSAARTACGSASEALGGNGTAVGGLSTASGFDSAAVGHEAAASGSSSTALGRAASASADFSTALGRSATASADSSTALGYLAEASGTDSTALGQSASASGTVSTTLGASATADAFHSTAVGGLATASGIASTALGASARASGDRNTALGLRSRALSAHNNATALGYQAQVEQSNAMVLGSIPGLNQSFGANEYVDVGIGTSTPDAPLHIFRDDETLEFMFLESDATGGAQDRAMMQLNNNGGIRFQFDNTLTANAWRFQAGTGNQDNFEITSVGSGQLELLLQNDGDLFITGSLTQNSDVNAKRDIETVDGQMLLAKLDSLPVAEWTYKRDSSGARHLGPMAQDFHAAFGLGEDETKIAPGDMAGISLAAIKALRKELQDKDAELAEVKNRLARLETLIQGLNKPTAGL